MAGPQRILSGGSSWGASTILKTICCSHQSNLNISTLWSSIKLYLFRWIYIWGWVDSSPFSILIVNRWCNITGKSLFQPWLSLERVFVIKHELFHVKVLGWTASEWDETITHIWIGTATPILATLARSSCARRAIHSHHDMRLHDCWVRFIQVQLLRNFGRLRQTHFRKDDQAIRGHWRIR